MGPPVPRGRLCGAVRPSFFFELSTASPRPGMTSVTLSMSVSVSVSERMIGSSYELSAGILNGDAEAVWLRGCIDVWSERRALRDPAFEFDGKGV